MWCSLTQGKLTLVFFMQIHFSTLWQRDLWRDSFLRVSRVGGPLSRSSLCSSYVVDHLALSEQARLCSYKHPSEERGVRCVYLCLCLIVCFGSIARSETAFCFACQNVSQKGCINLNCRRQHTGMLFACTLVLPGSHCVCLSVCPSVHLSPHPRPPPF